MHRELRRMEDAAAKQLLGTLQYGQLVAHLRCWREELMQYVLDIAAVTLDCPPRCAHDASRTAAKPSSLRTVPAYQLAFPSWRSSRSLRLPALWKKNLVYMAQAKLRVCYFLVSLPNWPEQKKTANFLSSKWHRIHKQLVMCHLFC